MASTCSAYDQHADLDIRQGPPIYSYDNPPIGYQTELEKQALARFDRLHEAGELLWNETQPRHVKGDPFDFEFRVAKALQNKPQDREQSTSSSKEAFPDRDGDWTLPGFMSRDPEKDHMTLILNKFCVMRPQFVLLTKEFQPQADPLNARDSNAGWDVLMNLPRTYMMIFNCGVDAGSSVGHKHLQVVPTLVSNKKSFLSLLKKDDKLSVPEEKCVGEEGFEDKFRNWDTRPVHETTCISVETVRNAPFKHAAYPLPVLRISGERLEQQYTELFKTLDFPKHKPHNVILTRRHLILIPRSKAWIQVGKDEGTKISGNAAAMTGLMYSWSEEQYEAYIKYGPMEALEQFGVPW